MTVTIEQLKNNLRAVTNCPVCSSMRHTVDWKTISDWRNSDDVYLVKFMCGAVFVVNAPTEQVLCRTACIEPSDRMAAQITDGSFFDYDVANEYEGNEDEGSDQQDID